MHFCSWRSLVLLHGDLEGMIEGFSSLHEPQCVVMHMRTLACSTCLLTPSAVTVQPLARSTTCARLAPGAWGAWAAAADG